MAKLFFFLFPFIIATILCLIFGSNKFEYGVIALLTFLMLFALGHICKTEFQQLVVLLLFMNIFLTLFVTQYLNNKEQ